MSCHLRPHLFLAMHLLTSAAKLVGLTRPPQLMCYWQGEDSWRLQGRIDGVVQLLKLSGADLIVHQGPRRAFNTFQTSKWLASRLNDAFADTTGA